MGGKSSAKRTITGYELLYTVLGFVSFAVFLYMLLGDFMFNQQIQQNNSSFVQRDGTHFTVDGQIFYVNGWNSYWLMEHAVEVHSRPRVREIMQQGSKMGLTVCRTWAFNDGAYNALQISPGKFDERVFKALDHVIAEARREGIRLLLSLVNNLHAYGGKPQYVKWAWEEGVGLSSSNDSFFFDPSIRQYFKSYVKTMLTRKNTITGIEYRNDPTIFAWELINEPRCSADPSGDTLQDWIVEMSAFVKSIDKKHLLTIGHEGFYGPNSHKASTVNPGSWATDLGVDFIRNSNISTIDFASVHIYPDQWFSYELELDARLKYASKWMLSHVEDGDHELKKPVLFTEFGMSNLSKGFNPSHRDKLYKTVTDIIYNSAKKKNSGAGSLFWQFIVGGAEEYNDDFGIVPWNMPSTNQLFGRHSCRLAAVHGALPSQGKYLKQLCSSMEQ